MMSRLPTSQETEELVAFLPQLYADGFKPIKRWSKPKQSQDGIISMSWPEYDEVVENFFHVAASECWQDFKYSPKEAGQMIKDQELIKIATLFQVKSMLTYCVQGERLCDGLWAGVIEKDYIRRLLERLTVLGSQEYSGHE